MATVKDFEVYLDAFAPKSTKMDFDNVGFLVGRGDREVKKVLLALDITEETILEAAEQSAELIVSHHPLMFSAKTVTDGDSTGNRIIMLIENSLSAICMHTNLDAARGGVNDVLAQTMGISEPQLLEEDGILPDGRTYGIGCFGELEREWDMAEYLAFAKEKLGTRGLRYYDSGRKIRRVAVLGGSGGSALKRARELGCDVLVTADVKYDVFLEAKSLGISIIDGDHFCTENVVMPVLRDKLAEAFPDVEVKISEKHGQTACFY